ncbi:MAG: NosD domain-containing protein [Chloroflexota bacterium]
MKPSYRRATLGVVLALGMLSAIPGVAFAAQPSCGDTLMANTTLTADLDCSGYGGDALTFGKKGITLNLGGYTIWGPVGGDGQNGIDTNYKKHVTIKHGTVSNFNTNVYLNQSVGGTVKNVTTTNNGNDSSTGVYISYGVGNVLTNVDSDGNYYGFYFYGSAANWLTSSSVINSTYGIYSEYDSNDHVSGNYFEYSYAGIYDDYSSHNVYSNNKANGDALGGYYGFYLNCDDYGWVKVLNNETWGNDDGYGFYTYYCYDYSNQQYGSTFTGNYSHDNVDGSYGFYDYYSINSTWTGNVSKRNDSYGFYLDYPNAWFNNNVANWNGNDGIYAVDNYGTGYGNFLSFRNNTANNNDSYGITADYGIANASGNMAHGNGNSPDDCYNVDCNQ